MLHLTLVVKHSFDKIDIVKDIQVRSDNRIIILNQHVDIPVHFIFNGQILKLYSIFEDFNIVDGSVIVAIKKKFTYTGKNKRGMVEIPEDEIKLQSKAQFVLEHYQRKLRLQEAELVVSLRLKDHSLDQRIRRSSKFFIKCAYAISMIEKESSTFPGQTNSHSRDIPISIDENIGTEPALEPSTEPLPILW
ncbi:hypothetical protein TRFO_35900 [Tritrichomonas foetus]|uniref:Uncharacterized protein n=1 Tax=Tritrichomonas foetus TaxID=1144522 RepID=A0A1J4JF46_9EUKA|nr:hypothetical protein TRFO_35900 [Tritrichomonas foetus]|eukprot:OHS97770.1 hypothetical protein TRFO_35900 [Tritrichomonas foetus]